MSAFVSMDAGDDDVQVSDRTADLGRVVVRIGRAGIHLDPDTARRMALEILAIVSEPVAP